MKVVALDVDGVLNQFNPNTGRITTAPQKGTVMPYCVDPSKVKMFNDWAKAKDVRVVVSSTWRHFLPDVSKSPLKSNGFYIPNLLDATWVLFCKVTGVDKSLVAFEDDWRTPQFGGIHQRIFEIDDWVRRHPEVQAVCALDDFPIRDAMFLAPEAYYGPVRAVRTKATIGVTVHDLALVGRALKEGLATHAKPNKGDDDE